MLLVQALDEAREEYKKCTDEKRSQEKKFKIGAIVHLSTKYLKSRQPLKKLSSKFIGPFPIMRIMNPVTVLILNYQRTLENFSKFSVFHCSLKPANPFPLRQPAEAPSPSNLIECEQHFEVKEILYSCFCKGKLQYLLLWKHFLPSEIEWVV